MRRIGEHVLRLAVREEAGLQVKAMERSGKGVSAPVLQGVQIREVRAGPGASWAVGEQWGHPEVEAQRECGAGAGNQEGQVFGGAGVGRVQARLRVGASPVSHLDEVGKGSF